MCLAACLFAWRGNILLTGDTPGSSQAPLEAQSQTLHALLEPVLGRDAFRTAIHTGEDGHRTVLILVDAPADRFELTAGLRERIELILAAATGFDTERDSLQIQPFAFARGTRAVGAALAAARDEARREMEAAQQLHAGEKQAAVEEPTIKNQRRIKST